MRFFGRKGGLFVGAAFFAASAGAAVSTESVTALTAGDMRGHRSGIAWDNYNGLHTAFYDPALQKVRYAKLTNGSAAWTLSTVDSASVVHSTAAALVLDSGRNPHVFYYDRTNQELKRARLSGGSWTADTVDTFTSTAPFFSAVMGSDGPRVFYGTETETRFAVYGTSWSTYTVTAATPVAPGGIALDSAGLARIVFVGDDTTDAFHDLYLAEETSSGVFSNFYLGTLGVSVSTPGAVSVVLDDAGVLHASYYDEDDKDLGYFKIESNTITSGIISSAGDVGRVSAITLSPTTGYPVIIALVDGGGLLKFSYNGSAWSSSVFDADAEAGEGVSLAMNALGSVFASYYQESPGALKMGTEAVRSLAISGTVRDGATTNPLTGVSMSLAGQVDPASIQNQGDGTYAFSTLWEGNYVVTPSRDGYAFLPGSLTFAGLRASAAAQDFRGGPVAFNAVDNLIDPSVGQKTSLTYSILPGHVFLGAYSLEGRLIKTLVNEDQDFGTFTVEWDGRDGAGETVASGIYFLKLKSAGFEKTRKAAVVK